MSRIILRGSKELVGVHIPPHTAGLKELGGGMMGWFYAGTEYHSAVINYLAGRGDAATDTGQPVDTGGRFRVFPLKNDRENYEKDVPYSFLPLQGPDNESLPRLSIGAEWEDMHFPNLQPCAPDSTAAEDSTADEILLDHVTGVGISVDKDPPESAVHIQTTAHGCLGTVADAKTREEVPRIVLLGLSDLQPAARIRKGLSYESILVDVLRLLRGEEKDPVYPAAPKPPADPAEPGSEEYKTRRALAIILPGEPAPPNNGKPAGERIKRQGLLWLVIRLSDWAVLIYQPRQMNIIKKNPVETPERASLIFFGKRSAPFSNPDLGRLRGFGGFLVCFLALCAAENNGLVPLEDIPPQTAKYKPGPFEEALQNAICWQNARTQTGLFRVLFQWKAYAHKKGNRTGTWEPWSAPEWADRIPFLDPTKQPPHAPGSYDWMSSIGLALNCKDRSAPPWKWPGKGANTFPIAIFPAVSYRKHWFLNYRDAPTAGAPTAGAPPAGAPPLGAPPLGAPPLGAPTAGAPTAVPLTAEEAVLKETITIAKKWLTNPEAEPQDDMPVVEIGKLSLIDRREIEDYLGIFNAISNYGQDRSKRKTPPLNISVFGPPGSGKSFGVTQIANFLSKTIPEFKGDPMTFNLSQMNSAQQLAEALHKVRNRCLDGCIPVVFFDEFDGPLNSQTYGWLKYFLAPMQDGKFTDDGEEFNLGRCILVFAGGINRTFEEFSARSRNQDFCEAKGPDFVSRLRANLNVWGVNRPSDSSAEADMGRYILRRALMLRQGVKARLDHPDGTKPAAYMEERVAEAFCQVAGFRHGGRSLTAIVEMSDLKSGQPFGASDLPTKAQLEMHVNSAEFLSWVMKKE